MDTSNAKLDVADNSIRVSNTINLAVIATVVFASMGALTGGAWFWATQAAANATVADRQAKFEQLINARVDVGEKRAEALADAVQKRDESRAAALEVVGNRLTRMEAQLNHIVVSGAKR